MPRLHLIRPIHVLVLAIALALSPVNCRAQSLTPEQRAAILERTERTVESRAFAAGVDFKKKWPQIVDRYRERIEEAKDAAALSRLMNQALSELGISHLELIAPEAAKQLNKTTMAGIGITSQPVGGGIRIVKLVPDAPAQKAGLKIGDVIFEIDGEPHKDPSQIRGPAGTKVHLKVRHDDDSVTEMDITRAEFSTREPETLVALGDNAFVLKIPTFSTGYDRNNIQKLLTDAKDASYLVIDLRNNGGGDFTSMVHFLSCLLPPNVQFGTQVSRSLATRFEEETGGDPTDPVAVAAWSNAKTRTRRNSPVKPFEGRIAVLINEASASASEIVSAALRELRSAPLVGTRTAGAVLVSNYAPVGDGFMMKVPLSEWVTIKGLRLEGHPLVADVPMGRRGRRFVDDDATAAQKAVDFMKQNKTEAKAADPEPDDVVEDKPHPREK